MSRHLFIPASSLVLACIWITRAASDAPERVSEPVVACPCASEFTAAVAAYNARTGAPLTAWLGCNDEVAGAGGLIGHAAKPSPEPQGAFTVILVSRGRWSYGHGIARSCEAWAYDGMAGDWGRPPLGEPTHGRHTKISQDEVLACAALIQKTAACPNGSTP